MIHFYRRPDTKSSLSSWCRKCCNKARVERERIDKLRNKQKYADKGRESRLKLSYGINANDYDLMLISQQHKCLICETHVNNLIQRLSIDHNHKTGKIRGLLCRSCNLALGHFKENKQIIENAAYYLERNDNE